MQDRKTPARLVHRDVEVISSIHDGISLSTSQVATQLFPSTKKASERLSMLVKAGFLAVKKRAWRLGETKFEHFYTATQSGYDLLSAAGLATSRPPSERTTAPANLTHLALTNHFAILLRKACAENPETDCSFLPSWRLLRQVAQAQGTHSAEGLGRVLMTTIKPDGVFCLSRKGGAALLCFLEIDLGGEPMRRDPQSTQTSLAGKLEAYCTYFDTEAYKPDAQDIFHMQFQGFRVLLVCDNPRRIHSLRARTKEMGDTHFIWANTVDILIREAVFEKSWKVMAEDDTESRSLLESYSASAWTGGANP